MFFRSIVLLACLTCIENKAITDKIDVRKVTTDLSLLRMHPTTPYILTKLPTSEPTTPQGRTVHLRRVKTAHDLTKKAENTKSYKEMALFLKRVIELKRFEERIHRLEEEQKQQEELSRLAEAKRLADKKHKEWLHSVGESNSCGYFPHSGNVYEAYAPVTLSDPNMFGNAGRDHMDF